ncbi:hypothetical protein BWQ96_03263 [Gracilariopsis chorda]|uniref:DUF1963 domain-containing protein n=1 Tax=Gracilariopsis chorda TaxID=448386 RepID=A0A2V3IXY2_9FLOR|nr:hypothetical protein BWQ96_03263 [Gracilariopsis chorda]|eukprot:PXF46925.1 hypothetical protein BWQ96_03263 [Gracilariopsis chorda]
MYREQTGQPRALSYEQLPSLMPAQGNSDPSTWRPDSGAWPPRTYQPHFDITTQFPLATKNAVLLHPRRKHVADPLASKVGGKPAWPVGEEWPNCDNHQKPFVLVIQLTQNDVPELPFPMNLDLFQLLWCPDDHVATLYGPLVITRWRSSTSLGSLLKSIPWIDEKFEAEYPEQVPNECAVYPERITESDPTPENIDEISAWINENAKEDLDALRVLPGYREDAYSLFAEGPGTKVGGFPSWVQDPWEPSCECGRDMQYLLTVSSDDVGDGFSGYRWAPSDVRRDETGLRIPDSIEGSGLCLGDAGRVYVFICTHCESLPISSIFQCS